MNPSRSNRAEKSEFRGANRLLASIVLIGLILRLGVLAWNYDNAGRYWGDTLNSASIGISLALFGRFGEVTVPHASTPNRSLIEQDRLVDPEDAGFRQITPKRFIPEFKEHIGLGLIMGTIWLLVGSMRFIYIQAFQVTLDVLCILLVWYVAMQLIRDKQVALVAAGLYSLFLPQIYMISIPFSYPWAVFFVVFVLAILAKLYGRGGQIGFGQRLAFFTLLGLLTGAFAYIRSNVLALPFAIAAGLIFFRRPAKEVGLFLAVALTMEMLVLSPLLLRNYKEFDQMMPTRGTFWYSVWAGFGAHTNPVGAVNNDAVLAAQVLQTHPGIGPEYIERFGLGGPEFEKIFKQWSISAIREHPFWFARIQVERLGLLMWPKYFEGFVVFPIFILGTLGGYGAVRSCQVPLGRLALFVCPSIYLFLSITLIYVPKIRYVAPGYVILLILAALPISALLQRFWLGGRLPMGKA